MRMRTPKEGSCDPIAPLELPHSLHAFHRVSQTDKLNVVCFLLISWLFCLWLNHSMACFCILTINKLLAVLRKDSRLFVGDFGTTLAWVRIQEC